MTFIIGLFVGLVLGAAAMVLLVASDCNTCPMSEEGVPEPKTEEDETRL